MTELIVGIICGIINYWVGFYFGQKFSSSKDNVKIQIQLEESEEPSSSQPKMIRCDRFMSKTELIELIDSLLKEGGKK